MARAATQSSRWWWGSEAALGLALLVVPAMLGGALESSTWVLVALSSVGAGCWLLGARQHGRRAGWHVVLWLPVVAAAFELGQLTPLPPWLLGLVSPHSAALRENCLVPLGLTAWRPISVDPPSTARALARTLALGGLLFTALQLGRLEAVRRRLASVVGASGGLVAVIGFVHLLAGLDSLFGAYAFTANLNLVTPFGNTNHLAAFLTVTSTVALGLALQSTHRDSALGWGVVALLGGVATFMSLSRGGIASFLVTWAAVAVVLATRRRGLRDVFPWLAIGAVVTGAALLAFSDLEHRFHTVNSVEKIQATKIELWPMFFKAAGAVWPAGLGRGAFELGFTPWQTTQLGVTFTHPESWPLQWLSEFGAPLSLVLLVVSARSARSLWGIAQGHRLETLALLGVAGLVVHDVFDFALELNAVASVAVVLVGLVAGSEPEKRSQRKPVSNLAFAPLGVATAVATLACVFAAPSHLAAERELQTAVLDPKALPTVPALARTTISRHPSDWVLYATMAQVTALHGDPHNALAWVNRWLWLRPNDPHAHVAAAQALLRLDQRTQALLEFKTAFQLGDDRWATLQLALAVASTEHDYERLFIDRRGWLEHAWRALLARNPADAQIMLDRALEEPASEATHTEAQLLVAQSFEMRNDPKRALELFEALPPAEQEAEVLTHARLLSKSSTHRRSGDVARTTRRARPVRHFDRVCPGRRARSRRAQRPGARSVGPTAALRRRTAPTL